MDSQKQRIVIKERMVDSPLISVGRYQPIPNTYFYHIWERFHPCGRVELIHCWKIYEG